MLVGVVGFSFGLRPSSEEPNPSNIALAREVQRAYDDLYYAEYEPIIMTQWEITKALRLIGTEVMFSVEPHSDGRYLDSLTVWKEMKVRLSKYRIRQVIVVAQPFLHLPMLKRMIRRDGYKIVKWRTKNIPFDKSKTNSQSWTRSRFALFIYAIKYIFAKMRNARS